jgi:transposase
MDAYSLDLRKRVLARCDAGHGTKQVAEEFEVSPAWVRRLKQRRREHNTIAPLVRSMPDQHKLKEDDRQELRQLVDQNPDATLAELRKMLGGKASVVTVWRALRDLRLSLKKRVSVPRSKPART